MGPFPWCEWQALAGPVSTLQSVLTVRWGHTRSVTRNRSNTRQMKSRRVADWKIAALLVLEVLYHLKVFEKGLKENTSAVGEGEALSRQQMFTQ